MQDLHFLDIMSSSDRGKNEIGVIDSQKATGYEWNLFSNKHDLKL